jgi:hypothetical protein
VFSQVYNAFRAVIYCRDLQGVSKRGEGLKKNARSPDEGVFLLPV